MPVRKIAERAEFGPVLARRPASEFPLSAAEKKLLKDQDWIDEEEADLILAMRDEKEHGLRGEKIRDFARRHGRLLGTHRTMSAAARLPSADRTARRD